MTAFALRRRPTVALSGAMGASGDVVTIGIPAWRTAMTDTMKLYSVGLTPAASPVTANWVYPSGSIPSRWGNVNSERTKWAGFGGAVFLPDMGAYGTWVFNQTGEAVWENNASKWTMSEDVPEVDVYTQPQYHITSAAAIAAGDTVYYSPTDAANTAIVAATRNFANDTELLAQPWDGGYPFALAGWVFREKHAVGSMTLKANQPHWFRYNTPRAVPASIAGTTKSIIVCKESNLHGPFAQAWKPSGYADSDMTTDLHGSGRRKVYIYWQNTDTGVWSRVASAVPDYTPLDAFSDHCVLDSLNERLYYYVPRVGTYYLDLSSGIASATVSSMTSVTGADIAPEFDRGNVVLTDGHPSGKRYLYFRPLGSGRGAGTAHTVGMLDLDTHVVYELNLSTRGMDPGSNWSMQFGYDAATNTVLITTLGLDTTPRFHTFTVPSDPTSAANYTVTTTELTFAAGVSMESGFGHKPTGERGMYHADLGVIFITQEDEPVLAFRPTW